MSDIQKAVREKYGAIAESVRNASTNSGCCGPAACGCGDPITSNLYSDAETGGLPADAVTASLGCGNPTALLALEPGQTVLDLGSGGGIDVSSPTGGGATFNSPPDLKYLPACSMAWTFAGSAQVPVLRSSTIASGSQLSHSL